MTWDPSTVVVDWGRLRCVIGGQDVTFFRDVPIQVQEWSSNEPFDDATLLIAFPQITPFEALPSWLEDFADVDLEVVHPDNSRTKLFEGLIVAEDDAMTQEDNGLVITVAGALYQVDFFRKIPEMFRWPNSEDDIMLLIRREIHPGLRPSLRVQELRTPGWSGVTYDQIGAWQLSLTGYVQELLSVATSSGMPLPGESIMGVVGKPDDSGYWLIGSLGSVLPFGDARYYGSMVGTILNKPATGIGVAPDGEGYWFGARDGGVFTFGFGINFQGSLGASTIPYEIESIDTMPTGEGYVLVDEVGTVYSFGNAPNFGGIGGSLTAFDKAVAIVLTATGAGYWIVTHFGYVYSFGDAVYQGGVNSSAIRIVGMVARPQNDGYWLLRDDGYVYGYGAGATAAVPNFTAPVTIRASDISATSTGLGLWISDESGGVHVAGDAPFLGSVHDGGGTSSQWTVMKEEGRVPIFRPKNVWDTHWTVTLGTQGLEHDLSRDLVMAPNAFYGEGTDPDNCVWRNSKYPNYQPETVPVFSGTTLDIGSTHADVRKFEQQMHDSGWTDFVVDGTFGRQDANLTRLFQHLAGLSETGTVNAQTWAAAFQVGSMAGDYRSAHIAPIVTLPTVEPYLYNPRGDRIGDNPSFDRAVPRIETYDNFGSRVTKYEGTVSAASRLERDYPAHYSGTLRLAIDPEEGSRFEIRAGQNILVKGHRGVNRLFHIARAQVDWPNGVVTIEVDTGGRDMLSLAAFRNRWREVAEPSGIPGKRYRNSQITEDRRVVWDCESGAGIIPRHAIQGGLWNVLRIPVGEIGTVAKTEITCETPTRMSVGVFDRPITHAMLTAIWDDPLEPTYWDDIEDEVDWTALGLIMAWGGSGQAAGFHPGSESDGDDPTGKLYDDASWYYQSISPPWLWVALWVEEPSTSYIAGRFYPGVNT